MDYLLEYKEYFGYIFITFPLIYIVKLFIDKYKSNKILENKIEEKNQKIKEISKQLKEKEDKLKDNQNEISKLKENINAKENQIKKINKTIEEYNEKEKLKKEEENKLH